MNPFESIQTALAEREPRERMMIYICSVFLLISAVYLFVWEPIQNARTTSANRVRTELQVLSDIKTGATRLQQLRASNATPAQQSTASLLALTDNTIRRTPLAAALQRAQPDGDDSVKVWLKDADFNALSQWLNQMKTRYNVTASSVSIEKGELPSQVNVRLTLTR